MGPIEIPLQKRTHDAFISYAHSDRAWVSGVERWLRGTAGLKVWWDDLEMAGGDRIHATLSESIINARALLLVLSKASLASGWVENEIGLAFDERARYPNFKIIPVVLDDSTPPPSFRSSNWIQIVDGRFDVEAGLEVLAGLYSPGRGHIPGDVRDVYFSGPWRGTAGKLSEEVCSRFMDAAYRLIGDAPDSEQQDDHRIRSLIESCGALVAVVNPKHDDGQPSPWILEEVEQARTSGRPYLLLVSEALSLPDDIAANAIGSRVYSLEKFIEDAAYAADVIEAFEDSFPRNYKPRHVFFATSVLTDDLLLDKFRRLVEVVTGLPCRVGKHTPGIDSVQDEIIGWIQSAECVIADVSDDQKNCLVEAGIALGANVPLRLVRRGSPEERERFMFRNIEVHSFENELELLGQLHRLTRHHRRRILNYELAH